MSSYPLLAKALARGVHITLRLDDDDAPTYHVDGRYMDSGVSLSTPDDVALYGELIEADNNEDVVWEYLWKERWGSKQRVTGLKP